MTRNASLFAFVMLAACKKDDPPPAQPIQPVMTAPPPATAAPTTPPVPGQMSVPGPTALACSTDAQCLTHRCNTQYSKCAFPCQSDVDCVQGTTCNLAAGSLAYCWPKPAGQ